MFRFPALIALSALALLLTACGGDKKEAVPVSGPAAPVIKDGSLMEPGKPQIASLPTRAVPGVQAVTWNMYWGENGRHWAVYVNGKEVQSGDLALETPKQQQATVDVPMEEPGTYEIKVALCNDHGCSESEPAEMAVSAG